MGGKQRYLKAIKKKKTIPKSIIFNFCLRIKCDIRYSNVSRVKSWLLFLSGVFHKERTERSAK